MTSTQISIKQTERLAQQVITDVLVVLTQLASIDRDDTPPSAKEILDKDFDKCERALMYLSETLKFLRP